MNDSFIEADGARIEIAWHGPKPAEAPTLVLLHEGLGSVSAWGDFPQRLQQATGCGVLAYARAGYGCSSPAALPRKPDFMHREAETLQRLLDAIGFRRGLLIGHSDGASIATIYAGSTQDHRLNGLVLMAPHFIVEDETVAGIAAIREEFAKGSLRERLARHHADVDATFDGWADIWLDPAFRRWDISENLAYVRVPILLIQGADDQYGTLRQVEIARDECYCPLETLIMSGVKHVPHREAADDTLAAIADFAARALR